MAELLTAYSALSSSSPRSEVSASLQSIIDAPPFTINSLTRVELVNNLLKDLKAASSSSSKSPLTSKDVAQGLLALKTLGKHPEGSEYIALPANLSTLLTLSTAYKDDIEASSEALRCIANALLLVEKARSTFLEREVDGGNICISLLEKSSNPDHTFILSRILFLSTASGPSFIRNLVEDKFHGRTVVEIIGSKLDSLTVSLLAGTRMSREAMSDLLKLTFNLLLHYPKMGDSDPQTPEATTGSNEKVIGDFWSSKLDGILPPLLRAFASLPPTFPCPITAPLTHVIHSLITIPISSSLRPVWLGSNNTFQSPGQSPSSSPKDISSANTPLAEASSPVSRSDSPTRSQSTSQSPSSPKPSTLDRALSVIAAGRRSLSRSPSPNTATPVNVLQRACDLLEISFSHYFPRDIDVDAEEVREKCKQESDNSLDDMLSPLVVLVSRLCVADELSRARVRQWLVPDDLDRKKPLEARSDMLGRCLRLLGSVYHPRLKDSVGEMLFAMSDSNATTLCGLVGYGNVAGFLFNKGVLSAPPPPNTETSGAPLTTVDGTVINPITGTTAEPKPTAPDMSDEEKEREMEKLFVLFDRLEKSGAIPSSQNPMRKVVQKATFGGSD